MLPNLNELRIRFVSAASNAVGFGHLNRCISLANYARKCGAQVDFLVFGNLAAEAKVVNVQVYLDGEIVTGAITNSQVNQSLSGTFSDVSRYNGRGAPSIK